MVKLLISQFGEIIFRKMCWTGIYQSTCTTNK